MMQAKLLSAAMRRETALDHVLIEQPQCVYCGIYEIAPRLDASGNTRNLDHFVPIKIVMLAREYYRKQAAFRSEKFQIQNYLLPCCRSCNINLGQLFFSSFEKKFNYMQSVIGSSAGTAPLAWRKQRWNFADNPAHVHLASVRAPAALTSLIKPMADISWASENYIIICPRFCESVWKTGQDCERALIL
jgi:hypothetical protein